MWQYKAAKSWSLQRVGSATAGCKVLSWDGPNRSRNSYTGLGSVGERSGCHVCSANRFVRLWWILWVSILRWGHEVRQCLIFLPTTQNVTKNHSTWEQMMYFSTGVHLNMEENARLHHVVKPALIAAILINDYYSWPKEVDRHMILKGSPAPTNVISVLMRAYDCSEQCAYKILNDKLEAVQRLHLTRVQELEHEMQEVSLSYYKIIHSSQYVYQGSGSGTNMLLAIHRSFNLINQSAFSLTERYDIKNALPSCQKNKMRQSMSPKSIYKPCCGLPTWWRNITCRNKMLTLAYCHLCYYMVHLVKKPPFMI